MKIDLGLSRSVIVIILLAGLFAPLIYFDPIMAATTIIVNSTLDTLADDGQCTLREAVISANQDQPSGGKIGECRAGDGDDTIQLEDGKVYLLTRSDARDEGYSITGDLDIRSDVSFTTSGPGMATIKAIRLNDRVLEIISGTVSMTNLQIQGGNVNGNGAAILNFGTLQLMDSYINGNTAYAHGGGIYNAAGASIVITGSTLASNRSGWDGGGIFNAGLLMVSNSTISGNFGKRSGGGIFNTASATLNSITVTGNRSGILSGNGGGLAVASGALSVKNSIIAGNISYAATPAPDCFGNIQSYGYNLLKSAAGCVINGDISGNIIGLEPGLEPLGFNEGKPPLHPMRSVSPAVDAGDCRTIDGNILTTDQHGGERPQGNQCDIGAYELSSPIQTGPVYSVTSIFDVENSSCTYADCSLRAAIMAANSSPNGELPDEIRFNFSGSGVQIIYVQTPLPEITESLIVDGFSQPGASNNTLEIGSNSIRPVTLDGSQLAACTAGLALSGSEITVRGLNFQNFVCAGIAINGSDNRLEDNAIINNLGEGVRVNSGSGNTITENSINVNAGGGIYLAPDTNNNQAAPSPSLYFTRIADANPSTDAGGVLAGLPESTYLIEIFQNPTCTSAQGLGYLDSTSITTDAAGNGSFMFNLEPAHPIGEGLTVTATGPNGSTSAFSSCINNRALNDSWLTAVPLSLTPNGGESRAEILENIYEGSQIRWYKFPVSPGSHVKVSVNSLPGVVIALHRDLLKTYKQLEEPVDAGALAANDLPGGYLPGGYLPGGYLPGGYLPGGYLPGGYLPGGYLPGGYLPGGYLPGGYLPGGYLPGGYLPGGYLPADFLSGGYLPGGYLPELYSGAIRRSLLAISNNGQADQTIERNTYGLSEDLYIQVSGPASLSVHFDLHVSYQSGICENVPVLSPIGPDLPEIAGPPLQVGSSETLFLWDSERMLASSSERDIESLRSKLVTFIARLDINGTVIDLAEQANGSPVFPRVLEANRIADANTACVTAKNTVAAEIKNVIDAYRSVNLAQNGSTSLQYVVLLGSDYEIPFFRYPDQAGLASEADYIPPVKDESASEASLRQAQVLGQDEYGAQFQAARSGYTVPIPELAVSRIVRTASQIEGMLDAYVAADGTIVPDSALLTGYDFVSDVAEKVKSEFSLGLNQADCTDTPAGCQIVDELIQPKEDGLVAAWSADALRSKLFPESNEVDDLIFFAGHFAAGSVLAADYRTSIQSLELFNSQTDYMNSLVLALGCHSGYSIPEPDALSFSPTPDWAETFSEKKATYVASTGYAYGDTELTGYGERLFLELVQNLRTGSGPVSIGKALVESKRDYMAQNATLEGIDDKTLLEMTLYGLPMMKVDFMGERINATEPVSIGTAVPAASGPGRDLGLQIGQPLQGGQANLITINPTLTRVDIPLTNVIDQTNLTATYYSGKDGAVVVRPAEPIFPLESYNVKVEGLILRGVGFRGGRFNDEPGVTPLTSASTTENSRAHPGFYSDFYYPLQNWAANFYDSVGSRADWLIVTPAQYRSNDLSTSIGTMRTYEEMNFRLYYLDRAWTSSPNSLLKAAAISAAPDIRNLSVQPGPNGMHFEAQVISDPAAGVQDVWVTFTSAGGEWYGIWESLDLNQSLEDPMVWEGDLPLPQGIAPGDVRYIIQAANGAGLVSLVDPNLPPASGVPDTDMILRPTRIELDPVSASGVFGDSGLISATLIDDTSGQPINERTVVFTVNDSLGEIVLIQPAITNFEGKASLGALNLPVGGFFLTAYFGSTFDLTGEVVDLTDDVYLGSSASGTIQIVNAPPIAIGDSYSIIEDQILEVPFAGVLVNDTDLENYPLTAILKEAPAHGTLTLKPDGSFVYEPTPDYHGTDGFSYSANDGSSDSSPAVVLLTITPAQDAPFANDDPRITMEDTPLVVDVLTNDFDVDGDHLIVTALGAPAHGSASTDGQNVTYTPAQDFNGTDSFSYTVSDGILSASGTVNVIVTPMNDKPICENAAPDNGIWIWPPNNNVFVPIRILGVTDPDGDAVSITITGIYQDEPLGKGKFTPDGMGVGTDTAMVRAEREGSGDGRVYHLFFIASDGNGGICDASMTSEFKVRVGVSHDQSGDGLDPIDGGALYDSTGAIGSSIGSFFGYSSTVPLGMTVVFLGPLVGKVVIGGKRQFFRRRRVGSSKTEKWSNP